MNALLSSFSSHFRATLLAMVAAAVPLQSAGAAAPSVAGAPIAAPTALIGAATLGAGPAALQEQTGPATAERSLPRASAGAVGMSPVRLERVGSTLRTFVEEGEVAGAVGMILRDGNVVAFDSVGVMVTGTGRPIQGSALFRIASMTKPITSVAAMMLVEEGRLALSDPVSSYIPAFSDMSVAVVEEGGEVREEPARRPITVHHLLTHRSGLTYGFLDDGPVGEMYREAGVTDGIGSGGMTLGENVERLAAQPLVHQPGEAWQYGLSTDVLGRVVEVASGRSLDDFFRTRIFEPLGMVDTHFQVPAEKVSRVATIHRATDGEKPTPLERDVVTSTSYFSGGAGLYSTAYDYARFLQMLLNGGALDGVRILSPKTVELMTLSHTNDLTSSAFNPGSHFGLGFAVVEDRGRTGAVESEGSYSWGGIFGTTFWVDPSEGLVGVGMIKLSPNTADGFGAALQTAAYQALTESRTFEASP